MKVEGDALEIYLSDLNIPAQRQFLRVMDMDNASEGNYNTVPIAIVAIPQD